MTTQVSESQKPKRYGCEICEATGIRFGGWCEVCLGTGIQYRKPKEQP